LPDFFTSEVASIAAASALVAGVIAEELRQLAVSAGTEPVPAGRPNPGRTTAPVRGTGPKAPTDSHDADCSDGSQIVRAVLAILRKARGKGKSGKEIIAALKNKRIEIKESSFRKHVVPKLKAHGIKNLRSRGGYYDPA
jgi:hypothetical protein